MSLFDILEENDKKEDIKKRQMVENEMHIYNLLEDEKEIVRENEYDPCDFDIESPFEEDDYYKDDYDYDDEE